jgi:hypothetical protein
MILIDSAKLLVIRRLVSAPVRIITMVTESDELHHMNMWSMLTTPGTYPNRNYLY